MSSEIERRLRRSFAKDERIDESLGGYQMYAVLRMIAAAMNSTGEVAFAIAARSDRSKISWLTDPYAYDQAVKATIKVLEALRPDADASLPRGPVLEQFDIPPTRDFPSVTSDFAAELHRLGEQFASEIVSKVAQAEATVPPLNSRVPNEERLARTIASNLGPIHNQLKKRHKK